ncbi:MAG: cupin domain-containing protein [Pseudomonadota bacterium]
MAEGRTEHRPDPRSLEQLLAPVSPSEFLESYADRRALLIPGGADKFASLGFDVGQFFEAAERLDPGGNRLKAAGKAANEAERYIAIQPQQARSLFDAGLTVCAAGLSDAHPALGAFAEGVRFALSIPDLRFNAYLSPDGSGFNLHYDVQPIFLIQIAGAKRWWYSAQPVTPMPRRYSSAWEQKPALESLEQTTLTPGDVLYLPAFTWHRARADGFSLGITLGTKGAHNEPLRTTLDQAPCFGPWPECGPQPPLEPTSLRGDAVPEAAREYLEAQLAWLRRYAEGLTVEDLWATWVRQLQVPLGPRVGLEDDHLTSEDQLVPETGFPVYVTGLPDGGVRVDRATRNARFGADAATAVGQILARRKPFSVADGVAEIGRDGLTRTESRRVLRELVTIGALRRATS